EGNSAQTHLLRGRDRYWWTVRRRGSDHYDRRGIRLSIRSIPATYICRTQDSPGSRGSRWYVSDICRASLLDLARDRALALRVEAPQHGAGCTCQCDSSDLPLLRHW